MRNAQVYLHYLTNGDIQAGARSSTGVNGTPVLNAWSSDVLACMDVYLSRGAPAGIESIHWIIDEAFGRIGTPSDGSFYCEETPLGRFEYLYRSPYAKNAEEVKGALGAVLVLLKGRTFVEVNGSQMLQRV